MKFKNLLVLIFFFSVLIFYPLYATAEEVSPVGVGTACVEPDSIYHLTSDIQKSPWKLNELYAVPVGTLSPELWDQSSSFSSQFTTELQSGETAQAFASACTAVWQNFFSENVDVIVTLHRTVTATDRILQCVSGSWILLSTENLEFQDISDWQTLIGSPFDVTNSDESDLQNGLQNLIDSLNSQPGAASDSE